MDWVIILSWAAFGIIITGMLALDLGVLNKKAHEPTKKEALTWALVWIGLAFLFNIGVYLSEGGRKGLEWTTGYVIELSLSVDNIFVFILIFSSEHYLFAILFK